MSEIQAFVWLPSELTGLLVTDGLYFFAKCVISG
jgi:hypothetical protein